MTTNGPTSSKHSICLTKTVEVPSPATNFDHCSAVLTSIWRWQRPKNWSWRMMRTSQVKSTLTSSSSWCPKSSCNRRWTLNCMKLTKCLTSLREKVSMLVNYVTWWQSSKSRWLNRMQKTWSSRVTGTETDNLTSKSSACSWWTGKREPLMFEFKNR